MKIKIPYGKKVQQAAIDKKNFLGIIQSKKCISVRNEREEVKKALLNPIGSPNLENIVKCKKNKIVIVINDITRPTPGKVLIDALMEELQNIGINYENIKLIVATGSHRANTIAELEMMIGKENVKRFKIENHCCTDENNIKYIGNTKRGMPIYINKIVAEADIKILTGVIVPHHTAGFSGGRKSIIPGVASLNTLKIHHSFPIRLYEPSMGNMDSNPFHQEALEAAKMVGVDFILNVVQNSKKETIAVVAGDLEAAHKKGVEICRKISEVEIPEIADIVVTSPGGFPRDINLYQSQKAVSVAEKIVKKGGVIILVAECKNGIGGSNFTEWMKQANSPKEVIERFKKEGFLVGSNKAFMFARALTKSKIIVLTDNISKKYLNDMFMLKAKSLTEAVNMASKIKGKDSKILFLPNAIGLIPKLKGVNK